MDGEIRKFVKVWTLAVASAGYCYALSKATPKGVQRLLLLTPVVSLFTLLPFSLNFLHLGMPTVFYLLWLGNFKLLLFAFGVGPLQSLSPPSLPNFLCTLLLPIKAKPSPSEGSAGLSPGLRKWVLFGVKCVLLVCVIQSYAYGYREILPDGVLLAMYTCHLYLGMEIVFALSRAVAQATLGLSFDQQFNEPYLTTSLQDFWGRRWNLMVSDILRLAVHKPIQNMVSPHLGRRPAMVIGMLASFTVSGLMHELIYYYLTRMSPTWEVTCFFLLHGVCTAMEMMVKNAVSGRWHLHRLISGPLTIGFVTLTAVWLFFPQLFRGKLDDRVTEEYPIMINCFKRNVLYYTGSKFSLFGTLT